MPTVRRIVRDTASEGYHFSSLVMHIINSEPFQMRVAPQDDSRPTQTAQADSK
jgi:hypothetical protein